MSDPTSRFKIMYLFLLLLQCISVGIGVSVGVGIVLIKQWAYFYQRRRFTKHPHRPRKSGKTSKQKRHSAFLRAEHFYFQNRHLFSCVDLLLLCYMVLNMGKVALF